MGIGLNRWWMQHHLLVKTGTVLLCLLKKKDLCTTMCSFLIFVQSADTDSKLFSVYFVMKMPCVCAAVHGAMFSGCNIHIHLHIYISICEVNCVSYGTVSVQFLLANSKHPVTVVERFFLGKSSFCQLYKLNKSKYCGISFSVAQITATNLNVNEMLTRLGLCQH